MQQKRGLCAFKRKVPVNAIKPKLLKNRPLFGCGWIYWKSLPIPLSVELASRPSPLLYPPTTLLFLTQELRQARRRAEVRPCTFRGREREVTDLSGWLGFLRVVREGKLAPRRLHLNAAGSG